MVLRSCCHTTSLLYLALASLTGSMCNMRCSFPGGWKVNMSISHTVCSQSSRSIGYMSEGSFQVKVYPSRIEEQPEMNISWVLADPSQVIGHQLEIIPCQGLDCYSTQHHDTEDANCVTLNSFKWSEKPWIKNVVFSCGGSKWGNHSLRLFSAMADGSINIHQVVTDYRGHYLDTDKPRLWHPEMAQLPGLCDDHLTLKFTPAVAGFNFRSYSVAIRKFNASASDPDVTDMVLNATDSEDGFMSSSFSHDIPPGNYKFEVYPNFPKSCGRKSCTSTNYPFTIGAAAVCNATVKRDDAVALTSPGDTLDSTLPSVLVVLVVLSTCVLLVLTLGFILCCYHKYRPIPQSEPENPHQDDVQSNSHSDDISEIFKKKNEIFREHVHCEITN